MRAPRTMVELYYHIRNEERESSLILVDANDIDPVGNPSDDELQELYDTTSESYRLPEYRTYRYIYFDAQRVSDLLGLSPSDEEVRQYYDENETDYARPATREVLQLMFDNKTDAATAYAAMLQQTDETQLLDAKTVKSYASGDETVINRDFIDTTVLAKGDLPEFVESALDALEPGQISTPQETDFGWQIFFLAGLNEAGTAPFDEVKEDIAALLLSQRVEDQLSQLSNQLDDAIGAGSTLDEALQQANLGKLKVETLGPISATNELKNGEIYEMRPFEQEILNMAFSQDTGEISPISLSADGRYYLVETLESFPSEIPSLEAVKDDLITRWKEEKTQAALLDKAVEIEQLLSESENPIAAAQEYGLSLHATGKLKRHHDTISNQSQLKDKILTSDFVQAMFALRPNEVSMPFPLPSGEYAIGILDSIHAADAPDDIALERMQRELDGQLRQQAVNAYLSALREKYGVEIFLDKLAQDAAS